MVQNKPVKIATNEFKEVEQQIIEFYKKIAERNQIDLKTSEIFAYFKIYSALTQKQLQKLTDFSAGFISKTLKSFVQSSIIARNYITKSHTNIYTINDEYVFTIITPRNEVNRKQDLHDSFIVELQNKLKLLTKKYPLETTFFIKRLNGIRNFIETQRRVHTEKEKSEFLEEDVSGLFPIDEFINYPPEIKKLESLLVDRFVRMDMFVENDPIINKILTYLITRERISQEGLLDLTGYSRSTISRNLRGYGEQDYVAITKKEYLKPRIYYMGSIGIYLCEVILNNNKYLISWFPIFSDLLTELKLNTKLKKNNDMNIFFQIKIEQMISEINKSKKRNQRLENVQNELKEFINKKENKEMN